ncbi:MAG: hypothetical protein GF388_00940 [Candidatus Aegiribacteria sp.]|nr:hypothetical protein [Candidatus Aegiribacteria sp.]
MEEIIRKIADKDIPGFNESAIDAIIDDVEELTVKRESKQKEESVFCPECGVRVIL